MSKRKPVATTTSAFASLRRSRYIVLTTFRKSGEAVGAPVWFAESAGRLYVYTGAKTGKVKRIRNNPRVTVAPCTVSGKPKGPSIEGRARIVAKVEEAAASRALTRKYWILRPLNDAFNAALRLLRGRRAEPGSVVYLEIELAG